MGGGGSGTEVVGEVAVQGGKANIPQQAALIQHLVRVRNKKKRRAESARALQGVFFFSSKQRVKMS